MSFDLRVSFPQLDAAVHDIAATVKSVEGRLDRLDAELAPLTSEWVGSAQLAYIDAKATWDRALADLTETLAEIGAAVSRASVEYAAADRRGEARFQI